MSITANNFHDQYISCRLLNCHFNADSVIFTSPIRNCSISLYSVAYVPKKLHIVEAQSHKISNLYFFQSVFDFPIFYSDASLTGAHV